MNNTIENNLLYRVDLGVGPLNWSDAGMDSGASDVPGSPDSRSSFSYHHNILVVSGGAMFAGSTSNGYRNMSFDYNVYWDLSSPASDVSFPCNPDDPNGGHDYISGCLKAGGPDTQISSPSGLVKAGFLGDGSEFCVIKGAAKLWCADYPVAIPGLNFTNNEACVQSDANFCIFTPGSNVTAKNRLVS